MIEIDGRIESNITPSALISSRSVTTIRPPFEEDGLNKGAVLDYSRNVLLEYDKDVMLGYRRYQSYNF